MAIPPPPGVQFVPNPMPAPGQRPQQGRTPYFQNLMNKDSVIKPDFDFMEGFKRALKVFILSYPEIVKSKQETHKRKIQEYFKEMEILYNLSAPDMLIKVLYKQNKNEFYKIVITCKRVVGRDNLTNAKLVTHFKWKKFKERETLDIDLSTEVQPISPVVITLEFREFVKLRRDTDRRIVFTIEEDSPPDPKTESLTSFSLWTAYTHPEGFEDWIDFGRGVRILINVIYKATDEPNITAEEVSAFHFKTIELMLKNRLHENKIRTTKKWTNLDHQQTAIKHNVSYRRRYVDPNTDNYFWTKPYIGITAQWFGPSDNLSISPKNRQIVKFIDMQIGFETNDNFEDSVCLCNEWCNWNAFFHYNPLYRFLLVRHHQLFMKDISNIPDMYLCLTVLSSCGAGAAVKTPVFRLIKCANDYRKRFYDNFFMKSQAFRYLYQYSRPQSATLNALTYNKMRRTLNTTKLCHSLDINPFSDTCIENLILYYDVLIDLHKYLSPNRRFIDDKEKWEKELDILGRHKYKEYIKHSYDICLTQVLIGYDFLLTVDYEYASKLSKTAGTQKIREFRNHIMSKNLADNPFNVRVTLNPFLNTFASIYKFMAKVDPILPVAHQKETLELLTECYTQMDTDFDDYMNANMTFDFQIYSTNSRFIHLKQNFEVFYTLKLYFYAFEIQKHCINSVLKYNHCYYYKREHFLKNLNFIFKNSMIEQKYRNSYPGEVLFEIPNFSTLFNQFYGIFWGRAQHEKTGAVLSFVRAIGSAHVEYQRLHYWMKNSGNNKLKFHQIIDSFNRFLFDMRNRTQRLRFQIIRALKALPSTYQYTTELYDHLVYYLVKANCSVILSTVGLFIKQMHGLQLGHLVHNGISFSLCKPGWVPLFKTFNTAMSALNDLQTLNIIFDDEFNRISDTCRETRQMIKGLYRHFYSKLSYEWFEELEHCLQLTQTTPEIGEFVVLHLAVGLSFIACFWQTFRLDFHITRKKLLNTFRGTFSTTWVHHVQYVRCENAVYLYLQNRQVIAAATPLIVEPWRTELYIMLTKFNRMSGQQLNIDLNAANV